MSKLFFAFVGRPLFLHCPSDTHLHILLELTFTFFSKYWAHVQLWLWALIDRNHTNTEIQPRKIIECSKWGWFESHQELRCYCINSRTRLRGRQNTKASSDKKIYSLFVQSIQSCIIRRAFQYFTVANLPFLTRALAGPEKLKQERQKKRILDIIFKMTLPYNVNLQANT